MGKTASPALSRHVPLLLLVFTETSLVIDRRPQVLGLVLERARFGARWY
ncbi:hypothetical protein MA5S0422_5384 [Mycobacteroides abscessus 5S-0422]|uniref:Uncharacterized protein n=1 Tax=Mycobacteroides abscessus subsp. bolletii 1513 TaxID=1299321 RepID=X8DGS5_9MYCO|nr:hypothetical protein MA5S0422_5384 [Mycobacteroides abscessus 5S-0422]EIU07632.1 hypothetical protein MA5S0421_4443 [Mycobacteroides abscessus 5S-0421]EIU08911.1 hypothetical protein MA5S0304_4208 [Mycobacteroides abscessus 5S-0304]EIU25353.1 hypothetical protein MA5S0817_3757 [Mycobacteroides abscessus 5S-0817]EIU30069.1 hypothetical protein MA5S1212_3893 [Mycobacteroides abscessus 5S-1212]EUA67584.1 hypothetical protein I540_5614 [Mycobacteroides abscessus subsp. bolletii 1513]